MNIEVDIHGMSVADAKYKLERLISGAASDVNEITVLHGYYNGHALCNMVRKGLKHKRIKQRLLSMNPGQTVLVITK